MPCTNQDLCAFFNLMMSSLYTEKMLMTAKKCTIFIFIHNVLYNNEHHNCAKYQITGINQLYFMFGMLQHPPPLPGLNYPPNSPVRIGLNRPCIHVDKLSTNPKFPCHIQIVVNNLNNLRNIFGTF